MRIVVALFVALLVPALAAAHAGALVSVGGKSSVMVLDARAAKIDKTAPGGLVSGPGVKLAVLRAGQTFSLK